jgi:uncharacterized membrane protein
MTMLTSSRTGRVGSEPSTSRRARGKAALPQNVSDGERFGSMAAGALLLLTGLPRGGLRGIVSILAGGGLLYRGITGHCHLYEALGVDTAERSPATAVPAHQGVKVEQTIAIQRSPAELYAFWRNLQNLPRVMRHLSSIEPLEGQRSRWVARGPMGSSVQWDAEIINERENELIAWRSLPGGDVETAGSVHFRPLNGDRGTAVAVSMKYNPPAGKVGHWLASLLGSSLQQELDEDLRAFKSLMETGAVVTTENQPRGNSRPTEPLVSDPGAGLS